MGAPTNALANGSLLLGPLLGGQDNFIGLGIFFDTYNNNPHTTDVCTSLDGSFSLSIGRTLCSISNDYLS
jgi:hypothetical protein